MNRKTIVTFKIILAVFLGILIDYSLFLLFEQVIFVVGSTVTVGLCASILYNECSKK